MDFSVEYLKFIPFHKAIDANININMNKNVLTFIKVERCLSVDKQEFNRRRKRLHFGEIATMSNIIRSIPIKYSEK